MSHCESWWVIMSHNESFWVIMSHTYAYSLVNHIISTLTGFTTWLKSQPRFEMMEFHKKMNSKWKMLSKHIRIDIYRTISPYSRFSMTKYQPVVLSAVETLFFDESWWVMVSHDQSLWVMMSHTYVYSLADHRISTLTGFTTWLKSQPRFEMMEFHKKWIQNGKYYRNIYVSTYISYDFTMINIFQWRITKWL